MFYINDWLDLGLMAIFPDAECFIQAKFAHAELPIELGHILLELFHCFCTGQCHCQFHDPVADSLIKYTAAIIHRNIGSQLTPYRSSAGQCI